MVERVPCSKCGNLILPKTAEINNGLCMACKIGFRKELEATKRRNEEKKQWEASPNGQHWKWLVNQPYETLSRKNQLYLAVQLLKGEVDNGGFHHYFYDYSRKYYLDTIQALAAIGDSGNLRLLKEAKETIFGKNDVPEDLEDGRIILRALSDSAYQKLGVLDDEFYKDSNPIYGLLMHYAEKQKLFKPFQEKQSFMSLIRKKFTRRRTHSNP